MVLKILLMLVLRPFNISEGRQRGRHQSAVRALPMGSGVLYGSPSMRSDTPFRRSRAACPNATPFILRPFPAIVNGVCRKKSENGASYLLSASPVPSGNRINDTQMLSQMLFLCCFRRKFQRIRRICRRILFFLWLFYKISV